MKRFYAILIALFAVAAAGVAQSAGSVKIDETNFPDENFRNFVTANYDANSDGYLSEAERNAVTTMNVLYKGIATLQGIEHFPALETLFCYNNALTALDVSGCTALETLDCSGNALTALDVSGCASLKEVSCELNKLSGEAMTALVTSLCDRTGTDAGTILLFEYPTSYEENVCTTEQVAIATGKNWTVLAFNWDLGDYEEYAGAGPVPTGDVKIDETNFPDATFRNFVDANYDANGDGVLSGAERYAVTSMDVSYKGIATLQGIEHFPALADLSCSRNALTALDLKANTALKELFCYGNALTALDVSGCASLKDINCELNKLSGEAMTALVNSLCDRTGTSAGEICLLEFPADEEGNVCTTEQAAIAKGKNWTVQAFNRNTGRYEDYAGSEPQPTGDVKIDETNFPEEIFRNFVAVQYDTNGDGVLSEAERNAVTSMDVSGKDIATLQGIEHFPALEFLDCSYNALTALDVSGCTALETLFCYANELTALDVSGCASLEIVFCQLNKLSGDAMTALVNSLCDRTGTNAGTICLFGFPNEREANVCTTEQVAIAKGKNWKVKAFNWDLRDYEDYAGSEPTAIRNVGTDARTAADGNWYGIDGKKLPAEPTQRGVYIHGGRKVVK